MRGHRTITIVYDTDSDRDSIASVSTNATADNLPGPGRIIGNIYGRLGGRLEVQLGRVAEKMGRGPRATAIRIQARRKVIASVSPSKLLTIKAENERLEKDCKRMLMYATLHVSSTSRQTLDRITDFAVSDQHVRDLLNNMDATRIIGRIQRHSAIWGDYDKMLLNSSRKALVCLADTNIHGLVRELEKLDHWKWLGNPQLADAVEGCLSDSSHSFLKLETFCRHLAPYTDHDESVISERARCNVGFLLTVDRYCRAAILKALSGTRFAHSSEYRSLVKRTEEVCVASCTENSNTTLFFRHCDAYDNLIQAHPGLCHNEACRTTQWLGQPDFITGNYILLRTSDDFPSFTEYNPLLAGHNGEGEPLYLAINRFNYRSTAISEREWSENSHSQEEMRYEVYILRYALEMYPSIVDDSRERFDATGPYSWSPLDPGTDVHAYVPFTKWERESEGYLGLKIREMLEQRRQWRKELGGNVSEGEDESESGGEGENEGKGKGENEGDGENEGETKD
ncbi:hypothetical protein M0805_001651 [Coniferiporia weirii]|nr:hypothetical protein M0805_001651 [Coniferiporia weirii]